MLRIFWSFWRNIFFSLKVKGALSLQPDMKKTICSQPRGISAKDLDDTDLASCIGKENMRNTGGKIDPLGELILKPVYIWSSICMN